MSQLYYRNNILNAGDGACVTFGVFDGVHIGHRFIIGRLREIARENGLMSVLLRLEYAPKKLDELHSKQLTVSKETDALISDENPDKIYTYPYTDAEARLTPEQFIKKILIEKLNAKIIVAGENCRFGVDGKGGARAIEALAKKFGYKTVIVKPVRENGEIVGADMIRGALTNKDIVGANRLLAHPYTISGVVMPGRALGRLSNMPTANLEVSPRKFIPAHGVYASVSTVFGRKYVGLTHIGRRPSVDTSDKVTIETYLFDFYDDIYMRTIKNEMHLYIRETRKFDNLDEVKKQVDFDILTARKYFFGDRPDDAPDLPLPLTQRTT